MFTIYHDLASEMAKRSRVLHCLPTCVHTKPACVPLVPSLTRVRVPLVLAGVELTIMSIQCFASSAARLGYRRRSAVSAVYGVGTRKAPWNLLGIIGEFTGLWVSWHFFVTYPRVFSLLKFGQYLADTDANLPSNLLYSTASLLENDHINIYIPVNTIIDCLN